MADPEKVWGGQNAKEKSTIRCPGKSRMGKDVARREAAGRTELVKAYQGQGVKSKEMAGKRAGKFLKAWSQKFGNITSITFYWLKQLETQPRFKGNYKSSNLPLYLLLVRFKTGDKKCYEMVLVSKI